MGKEIFVLSDELWGGENGYPISPLALRIRLALVRIFPRSFFSSFLFTRVSFFKKWGTQ